MALNRPPILGRVLTTDPALQAVQDATRRALKNVGDVTIDHGDRLTVVEGDITNIYTQLGSSYSTYEVDFTTLPSQTLAPDGDYTIDGKTWTKVQSANERTNAALINGTGLCIYPTSGTGACDWANTFNMPYIRINLSSIISNLPRVHRARVFLRGSITTAHDKDAIILAVGKHTLGVSPDASIVGPSWCTGISAQGVQASADIRGNGSIVESPAGWGSYDCFCLDFLCNPCAQEPVLFYAGSWGTDWPDEASSLFLLAERTCATLSASIPMIDQHLYGPDAMQLIVGVSADGYSSNITGTITRLRVEWWS